MGVLLKSFRQRKGGPLAPFLFLILTEGLAGLVKKAVDIDLYIPFMVDNTVSFLLLKFADDIILVGENSRENLWSIKSILRVFELASGLRINFAKSNVFLINSPDNFLVVASLFLSCSI